MRFTEIHDGAAQTAYVISLGLETSAQMAGENPRLRERLSALHMQSKQALWELRYPINLGPLFEGEDLGQILDDHLDNFRAITSIPTELSVTGREPRLPAVTKQKMFSVAHNALTNAYKYSQATRVDVELAYNSDDLKLSISDNNGVGLDTEVLDSSSGHGIRNMRRVAQELGGDLGVASSPAGGIAVTLSLPFKEV
jgi:signal transduction histidine kinase